MKLSDLQNGESAVIIRVSGHGGFRKRIIEMGFVRGQKVTPILNSPLNDPVKYSVMGYEVSLRRSEAAMIDVLPEKEAYKQIDDAKNLDFFSDYSDVEFETDAAPAIARKNEINIALVGNPNSGKTSLFNVLSGGHEHVGNYSGVTVGSKTGQFVYKEYKFNITDLPGTYSLSAYSPEERFVRKHLLEEKPDVILNAVVASNLERNLYLTAELIDLSQPMVVALNMYDELAASGAKLDYEHFGAMIGIPMVPTVAKSGKGIDKLLDTIIDVFENRSKVSRHIHINYGTAIEPELISLSRMMHKSDDMPHQFPPRYWALKMLEGDAEVEKLLQNCAKYEEWDKFCKRAVERINRQLNDDIETTVTDFKYGFIAGALQETYVAGRENAHSKTSFVDSLVANKWLGFPIFIFMMWLMFMATFWLGAYPQDWIGAGFGKLGAFISSSMSAGPFKDLLVNGIIGGVGSVAVFLPNILILYLFISLMEDSGYMARAAFIMDRIMHKMGLHGKSFIPLLMGFGCNVPAVMATRTIESRSSRLITILVEPFMSCSARIPIFVLLAGSFFPNHEGMALIGMYLLGIVLAVITARVLRLSVFKADETPFVMELPPYRLPTLRATVKHIWEKCEQYLKKIGGVILLASIIIWFLSYFPHIQADEVANPAQTEETVSAQYEQSYLGRIGKFCEPVMRPLGLNWKVAVSLLSGTAAKEIIVSTLGVLYSDGNESSLSETILQSGDFTTASALALMVFVLLYCPCIATIAAIANETGSKKWAAFSVIYNTVLAWFLAFVVYVVASAL